MLKKSLITLLFVLSNNLILAVTPREIHPSLEIQLIPNNDNSAKKTKSLKAVYPDDECYTCLKTATDLQRNLRQLSCCGATICKKCLQNLAKYNKTRNIMYACGICRQPIKQVVTPKIVFNEQITAE